MSLIKALLLIILRFAKMSREISSPLMFLVRPFLDYFGLEGNVHVLLQPPILLHFQPSAFSCF